MTQRHEMDGPMTPAEAKRRLREWGEEAHTDMQAALARAEARAARIAQGMKPWAMGAAVLLGAIGVRKVFGGRKATGEADHSSADPAAHEKRAVMGTAMAAAGPLGKIGRRVAWFLIAEAVQRGVSMYQQRARAREARS